MDRIVYCYAINLSSILLLLIISYLYDYLFETDRYLNREHIHFDSTCQLNRE